MAAQGQKADIIFSTDSISQNNLTQRFRQNNSKNKVSFRRPSKMAVSINLVEGNPLNNNSNNNHSLLTRNRLSSGLKFSRVNKFKTRNSN